MPGAIVHSVTTGQRQPPKRVFLKEAPAVVRKLPGRSNDAAVMVANEPEVIQVAAPHRMKTRNIA
jgi:hypothetical protein